MIDIYILWRLCSTIGKIVWTKGYPKGRYCVITVLLYFGFGVCGATIGILLARRIHDSATAFIIPLVSLYAFNALGGATAYWIAKRLPDRTLMDEPNHPMNR